MKLKSLFFTLLLILSVTLSAKPLTLVKNGKAASTIVIADDASEVAKTAAAELAKHLEQISGAELPIVTESKNPAGTKIYVGATKAAAAAGVKSIEMIPSKTLLPVTGYVHGGCSPVGMKKLFPTFIDETAQLYDYICVSAGAIGTNIAVNPDQLCQYLSASYADITLFYR